MASKYRCRVPIGATHLADNPQRAILGQSPGRELCSMRIALNAKRAKFLLKPREHAPGAAPTKWVAPIGKGQSVRALSPSGSFGRQGSLRRTVGKVDGTPPR